MQSRKLSFLRALSVLGFLLLPACDRASPSVDLPEIDVDEDLDPTDEPTSTPDIPTRKARALDEGSMLDTLGFAASAADDAVATGSVAASFSAPIATLETYNGLIGSASLTVDDDTRAAASLAIRDAYPDEDLFYIVLFLEQELWQYVVIATREANLIEGTLALDGESAVAVVIDENTGEGTLAIDGTLELSLVDLDVGHVEGTLSSALFPVTLASWPQDLLPLSDDGEPLDEVTLAATGTFSTTLSSFESESPAIGAAAVNVAIDGASSASLESAYALSRDGGLVIVVESADMGEALAVWMDAIDPVPGTYMIGGADVRALLYRSDGSAIEALSGTLVLDAVGLAPGAPVSGSIAIDGAAIVYPVDDQEPQMPEDCSALDVAVTDFAPTVGLVYQATANDGFPPGYDSAVILWDDTLGAGMQVLVATGASLTAGVSLDPVVIDGRVMPVAIIYVGTCESVVEIESGTFVVDTQDATTLAGDLDYTVAGTARTLPFEVMLTE